ncbi:MAG: metallophosphoesterase family protein [Actinobacteria bacterium]|nr:metallophosphoesterase family protein [Actinomycetota bacterium]
MYYFCADTHYAHANIIKGISKWTDKSGCRPFETFTEHNEWLIRVINEVVKADDTLWHLGDFSFGGEHRIHEFRSRLACRNIYLVAGNHDHHIKKFQETPEHYGFKFVADYTELDLNGTQIVLSHYPTESWVNMNKPAYHLHGHVHGNGRPLAGRYDVGIDVLGPLSLDDLQTLPKSNAKRHPGLEGGNAFAVQPYPAQTETD